MISPNEYCLMSLTYRVHTICGAMAAAMLVFMAALILLQIALRLAGHQIPSADDFASWALCASIFLALPTALIHGSHIRVTSLRNLLGERTAHIMDITASLIASAMMLWGSLALASFVWDSYRYEDVSHGLVAVPLWIPQITMLIGSALFSAALVERVLRLFLGHPVEIVTAENISQGDQ